MLGKVLLILEVLVAGDEEIEFRRGLLEQLAVGKTRPPAVLDTDTLMAREFA